MQLTSIALAITCLNCGLSTTEAGVLRGLDRGSSRGRQVGMHADPWRTGSHQQPLLRPCEPDQNGRVVKGPRRSGGGCCVFVCRKTSDKAQPAAYVLAGELARTAGEHEAGFRADEGSWEHRSDRSRRLPSEFRTHLHQRLGGAVPAQSSDSGVRNLGVGDSPLAGISSTNCSFLTTAGQLSDDSYHFTRLLLRNSISAFQCLNAAGYQ